MKLNTAIIVVLVVVLPVLGGFIHAKVWPCPVAVPDTTTQAKVDSIAAVNAYYERTLDSLLSRPPITERIHEQLRISRSLDLDSLRAVLLADPE